MERRFAEKIEARTKLSPLVGFWHTDIGPLNQILHLWAYDSLQQRADVRARAIEEGVWPPGIAEFAVSMESDILVGSPVNDPLDGPREWGNLYELRMYTFPSGSLRSVMQQFSDQAAKRLELYPGCFFMSDLGQLNRFYQLWPYKDWDHRDQLRAVYLKGRPLAAAHGRARCAPARAPLGPGIVLAAALTRVRRETARQRRPPRRALTPPLRRC